MSYKIGDRVLYPMHGAGIIEAIEDKEILGEIHSYYVMRIPAGDMKVMIPMKNVDEIGVRDIISTQEAQGVLARFCEHMGEEDSNWNKRFRENMAKLKSGNILEVLEVVKNLMYRDRKKGLSTGERKMLSNAKQILISELVLADAANVDEIEQKLARGGRPLKLRRPDNCKIEFKALRWCKSLIFYESGRKKL